ncbi:MAG: hypothetical protein HRT99_01545 [Mycoplasmatales bacterium]|nr:hypothetical protein [Mycoplasmatales bacterium]
MLKKISKGNWIFAGVSAAVLTGAVVMISIEATKGSDTKSSSEKNYQNDYLSGASYISNSVEFQAAAKTAYKGAKLMFDELSKQSMFDTTKVDPTTFKVLNPEKNKAIPVVFMDIDETILNNVAYQAYMIRTESSFSEETFEKWIKDEEATKIDGAVEFINHVWKNGGVVMFNSNRPQSLWEHTKNNLEKIGLDAKMLKDWTSWEQGINPNLEKPWTVSDYENTNKELRMNTMNANNNGYDLGEAGADAVVLKSIMRIGDNFNDFNDNATHNSLSKERQEVYDNKIRANIGATDKAGTIYDAENKLWINETWNEGYVQIGSNSLYGGWESALEKDFYKKTLEEKRKIKLKSLPIWNPKS